MAQLIVRNIDAGLVRKLKLQAARHGCSAEAEHRKILEAALGSRDDAGGLKKLLLEMPDVGTDRDFSRLPDRGRDISW